MSDAAESLLGRLPPSVADAFRRRSAHLAVQTPADLFEMVHGWMVSAGIAEGRGGYPGLPGTPGWSDYVADQRRNFAMFRSLTQAFGQPDAQLLKSAQDYEKFNLPAFERVGDDPGGAT